MERVEGRSRREAERVLSLSSAHIETGGKLEVAEGGRYVRVRGFGQVGGKKACGARGLIRGFSQGSRRRVMDLVNCLDQSRLGAYPKFVTLTYGPSWPSEWQVWKQDLNAFHVWLVRHYGACAAIWRLELQKRGAPHFHLLLFLDAKLDLRAVRAAWTAIARHDDPYSGLYRIEATIIRSMGGVMHYCAKYVVKWTEADIERSESGRHWGVWGRKLLPVRIREWVLSRQEFRDCREMIASAKRRIGLHQEFQSAFEGCGMYMAPSMVADMLYVLFEMVVVDSGEAGRVASP